MWVSDNVDGKIYAYDLATKDRVRGQDFDLLEAAGNTSPLGIWSDGTTLWVVDYADEKIYAYDLATKARVPGKDFDTLQAAGNTLAARHLVRRRDDVGDGLAGWQGLRLRYGH